ncbi:hypothetical protein F383_25339 [Gossypium arboreum]|uniref:Uncharacterized protein n=1 Tax=Gossypium arboreum TaxID=29729 RepID=A0A0B0P0B6_GOSAR|nr:hypothetical protein F383_25339 [Gossypium arboreum]
MKARLTPYLEHGIGNVMRASVRPCLGHGIGIDMYASVRPFLGHGIGIKTGASVRPCQGHGIDLNMVTKLARVGDRQRFHHTIQLLKGINDFKHFKSIACIGT